MPSTRRILTVAGIIALVVIAPSCQDDPTAPPPPEPIPDSSDVTPPEAVDDLVLTFDEPGERVHLSWTAPRDDDRNERVVSYQIRYANTFPLDWWTANVVADPPQPLAPGETQTYSLDAVRGRDFYAAIRSVDGAGLVSPVSSIAHVRVPGYSFEGVCVDAWSNTPLQGLDVHLIEQYEHDFVTDADGDFGIFDLRAGTVDVRVVRGSAPVVYHNYRSVFSLNTDLAITVPMIEYEPLVNEPYTNILALLNHAVEDPESIIKTWRSLPVSWYAPAFVNQFGVDYYDAAARAAARWNEITGLPLFVAVGERPAVGVGMEFLPQDQMPGLNGITTYGSDAQGYPVFDRIRIIDGFSNGGLLYSVMMHELGHTIRLGHVGNTRYIMSAIQPLPADISEIEARAVQLLHALPNGTNLSAYDIDALR